METRLASAATSGSSRTWPASSAPALSKEHVAQQIDDLRPQRARAVAVGHGLLDGTQARRRVARGYGLHQRQHRRPAGEPEHAVHVVQRHGLLGKRQRLVEQRDRVAQATAGAAGQDRKRQLLHRRSLGGGHAAELVDELHGADAAKRQVLAAGANREGHSMRLGGGQHEQRAGRRFFQRLQQGVFRRGGQLVNLVDDVDLVATAGGRELRLLTQQPHVVDAAVRGRVHFQQIDERAGGNVAWQWSQAAQGSGCTPSRQLTALASRRAAVVLPVPRSPENR